MGLNNAGVVDFLTRYVKVATSSPSLHIGVLASLGGVISTLMNNVGALALLMPVAIQSSVEAKRSPAVVLMPLAFGTILGGMVTLIGTPPNIIIAHYREEISGQPFGMFDFSPVGGVVAIMGHHFRRRGGVASDSRSSTEQKRPSGIISYSGICHRSESV